MIIRPAALTDLIALRQLFGDFIEARPQDYPVIDADAHVAFIAEVASRVGVDGRFLCLLAESERIDGFIMGEIGHRTIGRPHLFAAIHYLWVRPQMRGQGIGRALSTAAWHDLKAKEVEAVEINALPGDTQWHDRGWWPIGITYALPLEAAILTVTPTTEPNGHGTDEPEVSPES